MLRSIASRNTIRTFSAARVARVDAPNKSDAFKERENAQENAYIKKHEAEQLKKLKAQLDQQKEVVEKLQKEINDLKK